MTLTSRSLRTAVLAALAAFALTAAILAATRGPGGPEAAPRAALPSPPPPGARTDERIAAFQALVRARPGVPQGYALLAGAYLQKVRETGDPGYYGRAEGVLRRGLATSPADPALLVERAQLALSRHDFRAGLADARRVHQADPSLKRPYGVLVDALVELGRYDEAGRRLQEMIDLGPDLGAYARVSYYRELHGDLPGAIAAMELAVSAGGASAENVAYAQTLLGNLLFAAGRPGAAERAYREALARFAAHVPAQVGLARVEAARGRLAPAIRRLRGAVARLPLPEYVIALGETELAAGRRAAGRRTLALVGVEQRLLASAGVDTDVELALFEAEHGSPRRAVRLARSAWRRAPSVRSADALAWALARDGQPARALPWSRRALRLGTRDAMVLYRAGMTAKAAGRPALARARLRRALAANPRFSPLHAPRARQALEELS